VPFCRISCSWVSGLLLFYTQTVFGPRCPSLLTGSLPSSPPSALAFLVALIGSPRRPPRGTCGPRGLHRFHLERYSRLSPPTTYAISTTWPAANNQLFVHLAIYLCRLLRPEAHGDPNFCFVCFFQCSSTDRPNSQRVLFYVLRL